jgi:hypothetical protein
LGWLGLGASKFHDWRKRYGKVNEHNAWVPRDEWLEAWEKQAILDYHDLHPLDGYRRLCFMMLDQGIVAVSPSTVYRLLKQAGRLDRRWLKPSKKGTGFVQPLLAHQHWHLDISYIGDYPCAHLAVLSAEQRQARTLARQLEARAVENRGAGHAGTSPQARYEVCAGVQPGSFA